MEGLEVGGLVLLCCKTQKATQDALADARREGATEQMRMQVGDGRLH